MSLLTKIIGAVSKEEREGISMGSAACWGVSGIKSESLPQFLCALPSLLPAGSTLYLEGTSPSAREVIAFCETHAAERISKIALGTIWPKPKIFHLSMVPEVAQELAALTEHHAIPEICDHLHAYKDGRVLLQWHDAFDEKLLIAQDVAEEKVADFCRLLGAKYERV